MGFAQKMRVMGTLRRYQNGCCGFCQKPTSTMVLDHDHLTDLVRGLLCTGCNTLEGKVPLDSVAWLSYRTNPPARAAGVEVDYWALG